MRAKLAAAQMLLAVLLWLTAAAGVARGSEFFAAFLYFFAWWPLLIFLDGLLLKLTGESRLWDRPREFLHLAFSSVTIWLIFEACNLVLMNWRYVGLEPRLPVRWAGYALSFATVLPSLLLGAQVLSAITMVSTTGQGYAEGMKFVQFYFGLPIAMIILYTVTAVPFFWRAKVYAAYEYLERRFDLKTRTPTAFLFLLSRGLSCSVVIAAPSLILSIVLGWNLTMTVLTIGLPTVIYNMVGGVQAVTWTDVKQVVIIVGGILAAVVVLILGRLLLEEALLRAELDGYTDYAARGHYRLVQAGEPHAAPLPAAATDARRRRRLRGFLLARAGAWRLPGYPGPPKVTLETTTSVAQDGDRWRLTTDLRNPSPHPALMVRLKAVREQSGDRILPVLYGDNYVSLMPGETRTIVTEVLHADTRGERPAIAVEGFNVADQVR